MRLPQRFLDKVEQTESGCWEWTGAKMNDTGYGRFWAGNGHRSALYAHRFAYEQMVGPIPDGFVVDHLCRNRPCVNPAHLRACTQAENMRARFTPPAELSAGDAIPAVDQASLFDAHTGDADNHAHQIVLSSGVHVKRHSVRDVAAMYGVSTSHIRRLVRSGTLTKVPHMGRRVLIATGELDRVFGAAA